MEDETGVLQPLHDQPFRFPYGLGAAALRSSCLLPGRVLVLSSKAEALSPVGRLDTGDAQEGEQVLPLVGQAVQQSAVGRVAGRPGYQLVDLSPEASGLGDQRGRIQRCRRRARLE